MKQDQGATFDPSPEGERRHLTILFSDLVGSTEIAGRLDPEEFHGLMAKYEAVAKTAVTAYGGHVAQLRGDGVLAYFGWPNALESAAEGAVRAGASILRGLSALNEASPAAPKLLARVGIHAGEVVVNRSGEAYGDNANIAARIQAEALPQSMLISGVVEQLVRNLFDLEDRGAHTLKGISQPVQLFRVQGSAGPGRKARRGTSASETPFVGREAELKTIARHWNKSREGNGQTLIVVGEPGIGKSRLIREFRRSSSATGQWFETGGAQLFSNTAFFAVSELVHEAMGGPHRETSMGEWRQKDIIEGLLRWVRTHASRQPMAILVEDMHWADPSTLEFVQALSAFTAELPLLLIMTARPEFKPELKSFPGASVLELAHLAATDIGRIVTNIAPMHPGVDDLAAKIVSRADGVPLFAEELTHLLASDRAPGNRGMVPLTLADLLGARLDGLGPARELAMHAAVLGDDLPVELLRAVSGTDHDMDSDLAELLQQRIIKLEMTGTEQRYVFRHALVRDIAYATLLRSRRQEIHKRIAEVACDQFTTFAADRPEFIARHWSAADEPSRATVAWRDAGTISRDRGAFREAQGAYEVALGELRLIKPSAERDTLELSIQRAFATVLQVTRGYSAPETVSVTARVQELSRLEKGANAGRTQLAARWAALSSAGQYHEASVLADEILRLAKESASDEKLSEAYMVQMTTRYRLGELTDAENYFRAGYALFTTTGFRTRPGAIAQTFGNASRLAWMRGRAATAARRMTYVVGVVARRNNPYDTAFCDYMAAIMLVLAQRPGEARIWAERSITLSEANGFPQFAAISRVALGRAFADLGRASEGVKLIEQGINGMNGTGSRVAMTMYLTWLAEAFDAAHSLDEALATFDRALDYNPQERFFRPETMRLRAEMLVKLGRREDARRDMLEAMTSARAMGACCFEQRIEQSSRRLSLAD